MSSARQRMKSMSDASTRVDADTKPKTPKNVTSPSAAIEAPNFEIPRFEIPVAIRELVEKGGAQAKENYEKMKTAAEGMTGVVEATYATAARGATDYGLSVIEMTRYIDTAAFDIVGMTNVAMYLS